VILVRACLADTDIHVAAVGIDSHVGMAWPMMFGPVFAAARHPS
jgi:hypothetical protein